MFIRPNTEFLQISNHRLQHRWVYTDLSKIFSLSFTEYTLPILSKTQAV